jgi:hypothetical protein
MLVEVIGDHCFKDRLDALASQRGMGFKLAV